MPFRTSQELSENAQAVSKKAPNTHNCRQAKKKSSAAVSRKLPTVSRKVMYPDLLALFKSPGEGLQ